MLKQGYIVDFGPVGKLYPSCSSGWVEKAEDLQLVSVTLSLYYRPADEMVAVVKGATTTARSGNSGSGENDGDALVAVMYCSRKQVFVPLRLNKKATRMSRRSARGSSSLFISLYCYEWSLTPKLIDTDSGIADMFYKPMLKLMDIMKFLILHFLPKWSVS